MTTASGPASEPSVTRKALAQQAAAQRAKARKAAAKKALLKKLSAQPPTLREERKLLREGHRFVAGIDEVGRGSLAGPVTVGVVVVDLETKSAPTGVRDSKLLAPAAREKLVPRLRRWAPMSAVGHAGSDEIDEIGIIAALRLAAARAFASLEIRPDCALLDGSHDWLSVPVEAVEEAPQGTSLFDFDEEPVAVGHPLSFVEGEPIAAIVPGRVVTQVKADLRCAAVAAASVLAKVERDALMVTFAAEHPGYGWELNKGYSAPDHLAALRRLGPSRLHRVSWNIPGSDGVFGETLDLDSLSEKKLTDDSLADESSAEDSLSGSSLSDGALEDDSLSDDLPADGASAADSAEELSDADVRELGAEVPAPPEHVRAVGYDHEELTLFS